MVFLLSLLIGTQTLCSLAGSPPPQESPPLPPDRLISLPCNSSAVKAVAELALDKLNEHRREGYVLRLQRIFDVRQLQWQGTGFVYYLTLDVLETFCHVLSRKPWKDCNFRPPYETVYGQCKVTFYINKPERILHLFNYDCVLRPLPASAVLKNCSYGVTPLDPTQPRILEKANLILAVFNDESNHRHYFNVRHVTRALSEWVLKSSIILEYIIQETTCSKSHAAADLTQCPFLPDETADVGLCRGFVAERLTENQTLTSVKCDIFHVQPQVNEGQHTGYRRPCQRDHDERHVDNGHAESKRCGYHDHQHQHHHPHDNHHRNQSQNHTEYESDPPTAGSSVMTTNLEKTVGQVKTLPWSNANVSLHSLQETEAEQLDGNPVPPESQGPKSIPNLPDVHSTPEESQPQDKPDLTKPSMPVSPPLFPAGFSQSHTCPGEVQIIIHGLEHLIPKRPAELSPAGAPEFQAEENVKH